MARGTAIRIVAVLAPLAVAGCARGVLDPRGPIGAAENLILLDATLIMLAVIVPVIVLTLGFAWWFRAGNARAERLPHWEFSGKIETITWSIPAMVVLFLGGIGWIASHRLDPPRAIASPVAPIDVEVVSLDWKWLFILPGEGVASVNRLVVPAGAPLRFRLTSASVMNSFFVPQLGSQIYAMAGMTTHLNLMADRPGSYPGLSAQFSGDGFSDMRFTVEALPPAAYRAWLAGVRGKGPRLDGRSYALLAKQTIVSAPFAFGQVDPRLFEAIATGAIPSAPGPRTGRPDPATSPRPPA